MERRDEVWKSEERAKRFINEVRPALPWADEQVEVLFRLIKARGERSTVLPIWVVETEY